MPTPLVATGTRASLVWHTMTAADVAGFTVRRDVQQRWSVSALLVNPDAFKLAQRPLTLVVPSKFGAWRFAVTAVTSPPGPAFTATLGPPTRDPRATATARPPASTVFDAYGQVYRTYRGG